MIAQAIMAGANKNVGSNRGVWDAPNPTSTEEAFVVSFIIKDLSLKWSLL